MHVISYIHIGIGLYLSSVYIRHFKSSTLSVSLVPILQGKGVFMIKGLEDVQSTPQYDLPAIIALDVAVMDGVIDLISESNSNLATGAFYLPEILLLVGVLILAVFGYQMDCNLVGIALYSSHHLHELHQIAALVEGADKGVFDLDPF